MEERPPRNHPLLIAALVALVPALWYGLSLRRRHLAAADAAAADSAPTSAESSSGKDARSLYRAEFFDAASHLRLAEALRRDGRAVDAFYVTEEARAFFPEDEFSLAQAAVVVGGGRGGWGSAKMDVSAEHAAELQRRASLDPRDWKCLNELAHIEAHRGETAQALVDAQRAIDAAPGPVPALGLRAQLLLQRGDAPGAFPLFERAIVEAPASVDGLSGLDFMKALASGPGPKGGLQDRAMRVLLAAVRRRPDDAEAFSALGEALGARGDLAGLRAAVSEALARRPPNAGAIAMDGALALQSGDPRAAAALFAKALELDPDQSYALRKLAQLRRREVPDGTGGLPQLLTLYRMNPDDATSALIRDELDRRRDAAEAAVRGAADVERLLDSDDGALRAQAAIVAARRRDAALAPRLVASLGDDVGIVVNNAGYALRETAKASPDAVRAELTRALGAADPFVRGGAFSILCELDPGAARPAVLAALGDAEPFVRFKGYAAARACYPRDADAQAARARALADEKDAGLRSALERVERGAR